MRFLPRRFLPCWLALLVSASGATPSELPPEQVAAIDAIFSPFDHDDSPGYAIGVVRDGQILFAKGYGRANLDFNAPITPSTPFHLASLSDQFTGAAIALLILDGKLSLESPLVESFPDLAHFEADLRVKHLLYHTSGLPDYLSRPRADGSWFSFHYFTTPEAVGAVLRAPRLNFTPGTRWEFANVNYMMLALLVERMSGLRFADFLELRIFAPLGMQQTHVNDDTTLIVPGRATGYAARNDPLIRRQLESVRIRIREGPGYAAMPRVSPHYGDSGVFSSIEDLAKWDGEFTSHQLAGKNFDAQLLQRMRFSHGRDYDAFGLTYGSFRGHEIVWFSGDDLDTSCFMGRLPSQHLTVICLSNIAQGGADAKARQVLNLLVPEAAAPLPPKGKK